jgi:hypothetical protein
MVRGVVFRKRLRAFRASRGGILWNPIYKAWFPKGEDDPEIAVLRIDNSEGRPVESQSQDRVGNTLDRAALSGGSVPVSDAGHVTV